MRRRRKLFILAAVTAALGIRWHNQQQGKPRLTTGLSAGQQRFMQKATFIEAQQVAFYHLLAMQADRLCLPHLAAGYYKAMEEEADHLRDLKVAGRRLHIALATWEFLGDNVGRISGRIIAKLHPTVGLRITNKLEKIAAKDYASQRDGLHDPILQELYLKNQIDEEKHFSWAALMLKQFSRTARLAIMRRQH